MPEINRHLSRAELRVFLAIWGLVAVAYALGRATDDLIGARKAIRLLRVESLHTEAVLRGQLDAAESELLTVVEEREQADLAAVELSQELTKTDGRVRELEARLAELGHDDPPPPVTPPL